MSRSKIEEHHDYRANKEFLHRLCTQDGKFSSPIDLSLEMTEPLHPGILRWVNFYEPPLKMALKNNGDTVMIQGKWQNQKPFLTGGPLDGNYVFSQVHFHWGSSEHDTERHTISGKRYPLEMHVVFFKSSYQTEATAREKDDGIVIVVYFFKVEDYSSIQWMTNQLVQVTSLQTSATLPPAPLCSLMVPFTQDYLAYWGALSCSCHHVLWLVSRMALRVTYNGLNQFSQLQNTKKASINRNFQTAKTLTSRNVFHINPSSKKLHLLLPGTVDPPCQITPGPGRLKIVVNYSEMITFNETKEKENNSRICGMGDCRAEDELEKKPTGIISRSICMWDEMERSSKTHNCCEESLENYTTDKKRLSQLDSHVKKVSHCSLIKMDDSSHFSRTETPPREIIVQTQISPRKRYIIYRKRKLLERERKENAATRKLLERERKENAATRKLLEKERSENAATRKLLEKERKENVATRKRLEKELKEMAETRRLMEVLKKETVELVKNKMNAEQSIVDTEKMCQKRPKSPNHKNIVARKPSRIAGGQQNTDECIKNENPKRDIDLSTAPTEHVELCKEENNSNITETKQDENSKRESEEIEVKEVTQVKSCISKLPVPKFKKKPYKPIALRSSLTQYFETPKPEGTEMKPASSGYSVRSTPRLTRGIVSRRSIATSSRPSVI